LTDARALGSDRLEVYECVRERAGTVTPGAGE